MSRFMLKGARLAFPSIWKPTSPKGGGELAFSASFLISPKDPQVKQIKAAFDALAKEKWAAKAGAVMKAMEAGDKLCLHDGNAKSEYEGFEGNLFVSSRSKIKPTTFDMSRNEVTEADGILYSGCYVNASLEFWAQDNSYGKRINAQLRGVQFCKDGDAFAGGSRPADADEFDEISAAGDEEEVEDDLTK